MAIEVLSNKDTGDIIEVRDIGTRWGACEDAVDLVIITINDLKLDNDIKSKEHCWMRDIDVTETGYDDKTKELTYRVSVNLMSASGVEKIQQSELDAISMKLQDKVAALSEIEKGVTYELKLIHDVETIDRPYEAQSKEFVTDIEKIYFRKMMAKRRHYLDFLRLDKESQDMLKDKRRLEIDSKTFESVLTDKALL